MMHPWFRMVNPERNTLGEPAQDPESGRPMHVDELDAEIIRHMRWLFAPGPSHSDPEAKEVFDEEALLLEIQEKMTNTDENMEKLFYHLLCQHKTELLENYKGDEIESLPGKICCHQCRGKQNQETLPQPNLTLVRIFRVCRWPTQESRFIPKFCSWKYSLTYTGFQSHTSLVSRFALDVPWIAIPNRNPRS